MIQKQVGKRIKELRKRLGYSQEEFADIADVHRTYIASLEVGKRNVSIIVLHKIVLALNVSMKEFFDFEEEGENTNE